jgi:hypothetical protein
MADLLGKCVEVSETIKNEYGIDGGKVVGFNEGLIVLRKNFKYYFVELNDITAVK